MIFLLYEIRQKFVFLLFKKRFIVIFINKEKIKTFCESFKFI